MKNDGLTRQPLFRSFTLHLILLVFLAILFRGRDRFYEEVPVEITEFIRKLGEPTAGGPKTERKAAPVEKPKTTEGGAPASPSTAPQSSVGGGSPDGDPLAEDFEVSEMPLLLNEVRVPYPADARTRGIQGNVVFEILISSDGKVRDLRVVSSPDPSLTNAAESAVRAFKFRPARMGDKPVAIRLRYTYRFLLQ